MNFTDRAPLAWSWGCSRLTLNQQGRAPHRARNPRGRTICEDPPDEAFEFVDDALHASIAASRALR
jgi:hypothetical protein